MKTLLPLSVLAIVGVLVPSAQAADYTIKAGSTGRSIYVQLEDSPAAAKYVRAQGTLNSFLSTELTNVDSSWSSGKWKVVDSNGWGTLARIDLPNEALAAGVPSVSILIADASGVRQHVTIDLVGYDPTASVLPVNVVQFGGTAGTFGSGRPEVVLASGEHTAIANENRLIIYSGPVLGTLDDAPAPTTTTFTIGDAYQGGDDYIGCTVIIKAPTSGADGGVAQSIRKVVGWVYDSGGKGAITLDSPVTFLARGNDVLILPPGFTHGDRTLAAAVKTKTDYLPSATAGAANGLFIAGTNAATTITGGLTTSITGNLSGSVGSVTGNVGGNITGSVGSITGVTFPANFSGLTITSGRVNADVTHWLGTAVTTNVDGVPQVDITHVLGIDVCH